MSVADHPQPLLRRGSHDLSRYQVIERRTGNRIIGSNHEPGARWLRGWQHSRLNKGRPLWQRRCTFCVRQLVSKCPPILRRTYRVSVHLGARLSMSIARTAAKCMKSRFGTLTSAAPCKLAPGTEPLCLAGAVLWDSCYRPPLDSSKAARALPRAALKANCQTNSGSVRHLSNVRARATFQSSVRALENGSRAVVMGGLEDRPGPRGCSRLHKPHHSPRQRLLDVGIQFIQFVLPAQPRLDFL